MFQMYFDRTDIWLKFGELMRCQADTRWDTSEWRGKKGRGERRNGKGRRTGHGTGRRLLMRSKRMSWTRSRLLMTGATGKVRQLRLQKQKLGRLTVLTQSLSRGARAE